MWAPLWLQLVLVLVWGLASFPFFYWSMRRCRSWREILADEAVKTEIAPGGRRLFMFNVTILLTMFGTVVLLTLGMVFFMEGLARLAWGTMPSGEYLERPGLIVFCVIVMIPAIAVSIAPIDMLGRTIYRSGYQQLFVASSTRNGSPKSARQAVAFLRWCLIAGWIFVLVGFAASLRWFTWVGHDRIVVGKPWEWVPRVVAPADIRAIYGVESFTAPNGNTVMRYHPVIELRSGDHIDFSGEADGNPESLARVLEGWSGRHEIVFARSPTYPPR